MRSFQQRREANRAYWRVRKRWSRMAIRAANDHLSPERFHETFGFKK